MFWELYQVGQIRGASNAASEAITRSRNVESRANFAEKDIQELQRRVDSIALACQAMWELVAERNGLTDADLLQRMTEVDLRDGKADGKMTQVPKTCTACDRPVNPRRRQCMYCGEKMPENHEPFNK